MNESTEKMIIKEELDEEEEDSADSIGNPQSPDRGGGDDQDNISTSTNSSTSTIIDHPLKPAKVPSSLSVSKLSLSAEPKPVFTLSVDPNLATGDSTSTLVLGRKDSTKSKVTTTGATSFRAIRSVASRLKVANQLSAAKRASGRDDSISTIMPSEGPLSGSVFGSRPDFGVLGSSSAKPRGSIDKGGDPIPQPRALPRLYSELFTTCAVGTATSTTELQNGKNSTHYCHRGCEGIISGGELIFDNDFKSKTITRPYITVMPDADVRDITEVMLSEWSLPLPRIAVFMLGSVGELSNWSNPRQLVAFKKGLMKAANTTTMWVVTNGLDTAVGRVIGEAIERERKERSTFRYYEDFGSRASGNGPFHVIGIVNDHNLSYSQQFFGKTITLGSSGPLPSEHRYELNQQHSHFVVLNCPNASDSAGHNQLLLNLIDYLTKNAELRSAEEEEEDLENQTSVPCFDNFGGSNFDHQNQFAGGAEGVSGHPQPANPINIPPNGGAAFTKQFGDHNLNLNLEQQLAGVVDDTTDNYHLTTPDTSGAPAFSGTTSALPPETVSISGNTMSRQASVATLVNQNPPESAGITSLTKRPPSFVAEAKLTEPSVIVEHNPIPGVDDDHLPSGHHQSNTAPASSKVDSPGAKTPYRNINQSSKNPVRVTTTTSLLNSTIIPVVCIVVEGGYECAKLVLDNLRRRNPVIVLRGSGGFADLLSYAYQEMANRCRGGGSFDSGLYSGWDAEFVEATLKPALAGKIVKRFPVFRANALARNLFRDRIIECVRESGSPMKGGRLFLTVLNIHNSSCNLEALPEHILLALFRSQSRRDTAFAGTSGGHQLEANIIRKDLYLTIDWNCSHVALDEVLRRNPSYNLQTEKSIFEIALAREGREDFIDLFLSHGFRVHKYLTPFRLKRLLRYTLSESEFFRTVCMENILGIAVWSLNFEELLERLSLTTSECPDADAFLSNEFNQLVYMCTSLRDYVNVEHLYMNIMGLYQVDVESTERKALATLALWAVFNKKFKLAAILWKHSDQPVHLGLTLSMALDRLMWFVTEQSAKDELKERSKVFSAAAVGVLEAAYRTDERRAFELLSAGNSDWDQKTAVDIAANARDRNFIAHPCCQKWLTKTFNGAIRVRELTWGLFTVAPEMKIILSAFLIIPMYIWIRFVNDGSGVGGANLKRNSQKSLEEDFQQSTGGVDSEVSDNEAADKLVPERIKLLDVSKTGKMKGDVNGGANSPPPPPPTGGGDHFRQTKTHDRDSFRQRNLFITKQPPLWTMIYLLWNSPITKFWTFQVFYILFLALYSLAVIWPGCGLWMLDTTVCVWMFLMLVEHIRRTTKLFHRYSSVPMLFRLVEIACLVMLVSCYLLGRVLTIHGRSFSNLFDPYTMKVCLCMGLLYFYYRLFAIHLPISPTLGPLLYRFKLMISVDFIHFMRMAAILLISGGIVIQAILYPNTELSVDLFHKAFHRSAISLFLTPVDELTVKCNRTKVVHHHPENTTTTLANFTAFSASENFTTLITTQLLSDERKFIFPIRPDQCPSSATSMADSCPRTGFWAYFFTFQFLISLKLILLTLLYALFASTASRLQSDTDNIWKFQRYTLVIDFYNRGPLCAPLSIIGYVFEILRYFYRKMFRLCCRCGRRKSDHVDGKVISGGVGGGGGGLAGTGDGGNDVCEATPGDRLSTEDYNYWRHLAKTYYNGNLSGRALKEGQGGTDALIRKQTESVQLVVEELEHSKQVVRGLKTKITEMERLMLQTHILLEGIQHQCSTGSSLTCRPAVSSAPGTASTTSGTDLNLASQPLSASTGIHYLSRHSPYVGTRIQRFPLADRYVSWDVSWINYDPVIYSRRREDFPATLTPFVDEDILALKEKQNSVIGDNSSGQKVVHLPVFNWNAISVNPAGITYDRRSWLMSSLSSTSDGGDGGGAGGVTRVIYKLDDGIPLNPFGRTGLRGKGNLPRWGPNHYVMLILTRSRTANSGTSASTASALQLEFALELKSNVLSLPMRFVGDDKPFSQIRQLLPRDDPEDSVHQQQSPQWSSEQELFEYFGSRVRSGASPAKKSTPTFTPCIRNECTSSVHYMDSPDNTDNAWKELQVYHIHFTSTGGAHSLTDALVGSASGDHDHAHEHLQSPSTNTNLLWLHSTEDLLVRIPMEQVSFMNAIIRRLQLPLATSSK